MFDNLRRAFREAYENFKEELDRDAVPETVDRLLHRMKEEATEAQADVRRLEMQVEKAVEGAEREKNEAATCRRREKMAAEIADEETATLAREFAEKHEHRFTIFEQKAQALKEELDMRRGEVTEMLAAIKTSQKNRDSLAARAGRSSARESLSGADDLFAKLDEIEEQLSGSDQRRDAEQEVDSIFDDGEDDLRIRFDKMDDPRDREADAEERLERLKRAMGRED